jgi:regulatory protein
MDEHDAEVIQRVEDAEGMLLELALSDGAIFAMAPDAPEAANLAVGDRVGEEARAGLQAAADRKTVAREVFRLLDRRVYSRARLAQKLLERGHAAPAIDAVLSQFETEGLVDDRAFSRSYCRDQLRQRPVGRRWLRHRLRQQGVDESDIAVVLDEVLDRDRETTLARQALSSRPPASTSADVARAMRFLLSRGFPEALARETVFEAAPPRSRTQPDLEVDGP